MTTTEEKKIARLNKIKFDTHVNLIMIAGGSKNDAIVQAYIEGPGGLDKLKASPAGMAMPKQEQKS